MYSISLCVKKKNHELTSERQRQRWVQQTTICRWCTQRFGLSSYIEKYGQEALPQLFCVFYFEKMIKIYVGHECMMDMSELYVECDENELLTQNVDDE